MGGREEGFITEAFFQQRGFIIPFHVFAAIFCNYTDSVSWLKLKTIFWKLVCFWFS